MDEQKKEDPFRILPVWVTKKIIIKTILIFILIIGIIASIAISSIAIYRINNWVDGAGYQLKPKK